MAFKSLSPPDRRVTALDPGGVRVSAKLAHKDDPASALIVSVAIGSALFEEWGSPDKVGALLGEGPDAGKLQLKAMHPDNTAPGFHPRIAPRGGSASIRIALPGVRRALKGATVEHDLAANELTFILPPEIFRAPPAATHAGEGARAQGGVSSSALH